MKHMSITVGGVTTKRALIPLVRILFIQSYLLIMYIGLANVKVIMYNYNCMSQMFDKQKSVI